MISLIIIPPSVCTNRLMNRHADIKILKYLHNNAVEIPAVTSPLFVSVHVTNQSPLIGNALLYITSQRLGILFSDWSARWLTAVNTGQRESRKHLNKVSITTAVN